MDDTFVFPQGDFARPEMLSDPVIYGRHLFLEAIRQFAPEVLQELRAIFEKQYSSHTGPIPYSVKRRFAAEMSRHRPAESAPAAHRIPSTFTWAELQKASDDFYPQLVPVRAALERWAEKFHIKIDWMLDIALYTLQWWEIIPDSVYGPDDDGSLPEASKTTKELDSESLDKIWDDVVGRVRPIPVDEDDDSREPAPVKLFLAFAGPSANNSDLFTREERRFTFTIDDAGWDPIREAWQVFSARIRKKCEQHLPEYKERLTALALEKGCTRTSRKRELDHFRWFVLFQVKGQAKRFVASQTGRAKTPPNTLQNALEAVAKQIGLPLRDNPPEERSRTTARSGAVPSTPKFSVKPKTR